MVTCQFDFISFAQYKAMNRDMTQNPAVVFEEQQPVESVVNETAAQDAPPAQQFVKRVVRRDPSITNAMLPAEHGRRVGEAILDRLVETFAQTASALPLYEKEVASSPLGRPSPEQVLAGLQQLVSLFLVNGFAFGGSAAMVDQKANGATQFCLTLSSPANLWGAQSLQFGQCVLVNDYL